MAEDNDDPREVAWHPRHAQHVLGHDAAMASFTKAFDAGQPHHAWLVTGPLGSGKATLCYALARHVLATSMDAGQSNRWIKGRAHPDLAILERSFNDSKPRKLRSEITVDDARKFIDFFARTSGGGGWRVGLVDAADDLNIESANALLKLVEEPPAKALIMLVCSNPGKLLRTMRSRCRKLALSSLNDADMRGVLGQLPIENPMNPGQMDEVIAIAGGSPGFALHLLHNDGAKAFQAFRAAKRLDAPMRASIGQFFSTRATAGQNFLVFMDLLLDWVSQQGKLRELAGLAQLHADLTRQQDTVEAYNLDRRSAVMEVLVQVDHALKAA